MRFLLIILWILQTATIYGETPFGKDTDLIHKNASKKMDKKCETIFFGPVVENLIHFHCTVISEADGPRSHFRPSSSRYMLNALRKYGFFTGYAYGCDRLMRENEDLWVYKTFTDESGMLFKSDPVP
jgi:uncharacterized protein